MGVVTCQRQHHRVQPSPIRVRDFLYVSHGENRQMLVAVRVNGYLLDVLLLDAGRIAHYPLRPLSDEVAVTVEEVVEDLDLRHPSNATYRNFDFFSQLTKNDRI